ncbi:N-acetylated-alpha-linked acidic dipeptidase [Pedobacter antarcticus]|nr:M28 family metallopeptidase [Pedobacter antarcticus]SFE43501.1 N-acetylated-alpha-linked acidic dipeptidase [Pedobacter antarcticus]
MNKRLLFSTLSMSLISGFVFAQQPDGQTQLENRFDQFLSKENIGHSIKELSAKPHHLGSEAGKEVALKLNDLFKSYGWNSQIETFYVLFPTPVERKLELLLPVKFSATLKEPAVPGDATSGQQGQLPTYNVWGADGDVTAPLVFVNYGLPADYRELASRGIDVKGKIVIAKYGNSWRGIKPKVAYEHGAVGCIIYSDPIDDGYYQGDAYPEGPFKNEHTVQRGSVMDMVIYPGDPLTPGYASVKNAKRLTKDEAVTILKIPVLPISYHDAKPLLEALDGPVAPASWRGALPFTYRIGGGDKTKVHLKIKQNWDIVPVYNVVAKIKGSEYPDEWIIRGNHHDAWVNGASDPVSGLASLLEEAKAIGELVKQGYKPKRTLVYTAWDGEEQSLLGSTEWVEQHAEELSEKAVAYINTDNNSSGFFSAGGSHALSDLVTSITKSVKDPITQATIFDRKRASEIIKASGTAKKKALLESPDYNLGALGTGSDYSAFLQHLGIPSLNFGFGGESTGGEYHSIYDSYDNYIRFKDPGFNYGLALSQAAGRAVLRLADAEKLPFNFTGLYTAVQNYTDEVIGSAKNLQQEAGLQHQLIDSDIYKLAADPKEPFQAKEKTVEVPTFDFIPLTDALLGLKKEAAALQLRQQKFTGDQKAIRQNNQKLYQAEKTLLLENGLPRRPWYKHSIYAPGFYTGYGVKTLPGIREGIEEGHYDEAKQELVKLTGAINKLTQYLTTIY